MTVDHFQPRSRGGLDEPENWVYCCHACNEFKGVWWQPDSLRRILHPFRDDIAAHIVENEDGTLRGLTEIGTFHIERLHLKRSPLVAYRRETRLLEAGRNAQKRLLKRLQDLADDVETLSASLAQLQRRQPEV